MHIQWARQLGLFLTCVFCAIVAAATITSAAVWVALIIVVLGLTVVHYQRAYRRRELRTVVAHLREPGDAWRVRMNAQDYLHRLWDPSRPLGPGNGIRGGGTGRYTLDSDGQVTFDWRPIIGATQRFVGPLPRVPETPSPPRQRNTTRLVVVVGAYVGALVAGGLTAGVVSDNVTVGFASAITLMAVLPLTTAAVSGWHSHHRTAAATTTGSTTSAGRSHSQ